MTISDTGPPCVFDLETDGLLDECSKIHSLVVWQDGEIHSYADQPGFTGVDVGLRQLERASKTYAHNGIDFDYPALRKLTGLELDVAHDHLDTLVMSRLMFADIAERDHRKRAASQRAGARTMPGKLVGKHSLEAWGWRLGDHKGDFGSKTDWSVWTPEMQSYCEQDVRLTARLVELLLHQKWPEESIQLEHEFARAIHRMTRNGIGFDEKRAMELYQELDGRLASLQDEIQDEFPPTVQVGKRPSCWSGECGGLRFGAETKGEVADHFRRAGFSPSKVTFTKGAPRYKIIPFNPKSQKQVSERLRGRGWVPSAFTPSGDPAVTDAALASVDIPGVEPIRKFLLVKKRIEQLAEANEAWMRRQVGGRIHGAVNTNGTVTGRCAHFRPNMAQVPGAETEKNDTGEEELVWGEPAGWGTDCRALFGPTRPGWKQVGADASGLELRVLAHYLGRWDGGAYARVILEGDIHCHNRDVFGLEPTARGRSKSKVGVYTLIYGGGDEKLGGALGHLIEEHEKRAQAAPLPQWQKRSMAKHGPVTPERVRAVKRGAYARGRIMDGLTGYRELSSRVTERVKSQGYLRGLDGRRLNIRKPHAALNTLIQSGGAIIIKAATLGMFDELEMERGLPHGEEWALMAHVHDEVQAEAKDQARAHDVGSAFVLGLKSAEERFGLRCPLDGEYKIGGCWAETH